MLLRLSGWRQFVWSYLGGAVVGGGAFVLFTTLLPVSYTHLDVYKRQDWSRQVVTCDPEYYKWTQWAFIQLFHHYYDTATDHAESIDKLVKHCLLYTSRCV